MPEDWRGYLRQRHAHAGKLEIRRDALIAILGGVLGWFVPARVTAMHPVWFAVLTAVVAVILFEVGAYIWRFVWVAPKRMHFDDLRALEEAKAEWRQTHQAALGQIATLESELHQRKHVLVWSDHATENMIGVIKAFELLRGRPPEDRVEVWVTAPESSRRIASVVMLLANVGCNCGPKTFDPAINPKYDALTNEGAKPGVVRLHMAEFFGHALEIQDRLGVLFRIERTYEMPSMWTAKPERLLWLQFGPDVKWTTELLSK